MTSAFLTFDRKPRSIEPILDMDAVAQSLRQNGIQVVGPSQKVEVMRKTKCSLYRLATA